MKADEPLVEAEADTAVWEPCRPNTSEYEEASRQIAAFDQLVNSLNHDSDPKAANAELAKLLDHPCIFALDSLDRMVADTGLAMKTWWDRGGSMWLEHFLELWNERAELRYWVKPNAMPKTLNLDVAPTHPLSSILCRHGDTTCGVVSRGWLARATHHFNLYAHAEHDSHTTAFRDCTEATKTVPEADRFAKWVACASEIQPETEALPLGTFRAPSNGWLVVRGRRGHYNFCDEIRAYGLKTGAMYVAKSCSGLSLNTDGTVDHRKTDAARKVQTEVAQLPLSNLREAALMILLSEHAQNAAHWYAWGRAIPTGMKATRRMSVGLELRGFSGSGHTSLQWTYLRNNRAISEGALRYPDNLNSAVKDHAMRLLKIAESAGVAGCASERLPKLPFSQAPGVHVLDADPMSLANANSSLAAAIRELRSKAKSCP